jgi:hypothetical protein
MRHSICLSTNSVLCLFSYLSVYGLILLFELLSYTGGSIVYVFGALRASRTIHRKLLESVLGTTLRYVTKCPVLTSMNDLISSTAQVAGYYPYVSSDHSCYSGHPRA